MSIDIRPLQTPEAFLAAEYLERTIWGKSDTTGRFVTNKINRKGPDDSYVLLGAFDNARSSPAPITGNPDPTLVGFLYSSPVIDPEPAQYIDIAGILPAYQNRGIGYQLFLALREQLLIRGRGARALKSDRVTWTYDPMLHRHAFLYLHKLGGKTNTYRPNCYGEMNDVFNAGLPSDRLSVTWMIAEPSVEARLARIPQTLSLGRLRGEGVPILNPTPPNPATAFLPPDPALLCKNQILIRIPNHFHAIKATDLALARCWQQQVQVHFCAAFAEGFIATDVILTDDVRIDGIETKDSTYYLLEREHQG